MNHSIAGITALIAGLIIVAPVVIIGLIVNNHGLGAAGQGPHHRADGETGGRSGRNAAPTGTAAIIWTPTAISSDVHITVVVWAIGMILLGPRPRARLRARAWFRTPAWFVARWMIAFGPEAAAAKTAVITDPAMITPEAPASMKTATPSLNFLVH
jgi:hypothetical protein